MGILSRATRNLARRKTRAVLVIAALSLALTMLIVLPPSIQARQDITRQAVDYFVEINDYVTSTVTLSATEIQCSYPVGFDPEIVFSGKDVWFTQPLMNDTIYSQVLSIPDIINVIPLLRVLGTPDRPYAITGVPLDNASYQMDRTILPTNITAGRNLEVGDKGVVVLDLWTAQMIINPNIRAWLSDTGELVLNETTIEKLTAMVGGTITIEGHEFTVVGLAGESLTTGGAIMSLADAWEITNTTGQAWQYRIFADDINNVNTITARIQSIDPKLEVTSGVSQQNIAEPLKNQITTLTQTAQNNLNQIQGIGLMEIGIAVVAATAIILFLMLYSVRERTKEIGTLKAMGAGNGTILGQFMTEGVLLSLIAAVIAIALSVFVLPLLASLLLPAPVAFGPSIGPVSMSNQTLILYPDGVYFGDDPNFIPGQESNIIAASITPQILLMGLGAALLLGALGTLYPALKAARTKPAEAMRYE
ncbi:MAG: FtsX-like permease family protein [Candidatus Bathyarchaeota archaeon]|nr:FtsX-like permease family protein [Candidatus Bathyarchaeota archaeon]